MFQYFKSCRAVDDAALTAPDDWAGKNVHTQHQMDNHAGIITQPPLGSFYCTVKRKEIALIASDFYFTLGARFMLEDVRDSVLHVYKNPDDFKKSVVKKFDLIIFSAIDTCDISRLYRLIISLRLRHRDAFIIAIANDDIIPSLSRIIRRHSRVKLLSSRVSLPIIRREVLMRLRRFVVREEEKLFPANLTPRQADILSMAASGLTVDDIALRAGISTSTVYTLKAQALDKAGAINKALEAILINALQSQPLYSLPYRKPAQMMECSVIE